MPERSIKDMLLKISMTVAWKYSSYLFRCGTSTSYFDTIFEYYDIAIRLAKTVLIEHGGIKSRMQHKHSGFQTKETELYFVVILLEYLYRKGSIKSSNNVDEIILIKNEIEKYIWNDLTLVLCSFCYSEMDQGQSWPSKVIPIQVEFPPEDRN